MDLKFDRLCYVDLNIGGYTFLCSFLHGDLIIFEHDLFVFGPLIIGFEKQKHHLEDRKTNKD
jgi:hypothetical protein